MAETNGARNKNAGHAWELKIVQMFIKAGFPNVVTTRSESRGRDAQKIDVMNKDEWKNGRLPYNVQAKTTAKACNYPAILKELPQDGEEVNVILHRQTKKSETGSRFLVKGFYAIMDVKSFFKIIERLRKLEEGVKLMLNYFDYIPDEEKEGLDKQLKALGIA